MISKDNQISLTYRLGGEYLVKAGSYKSAEVKNSEVIKPLEVISKAEYSYATQRTTLGTEFTEACLTRPKKPAGRNTHWWLRSPLGKLYTNWKNLTQEQRIEAQVKIYVEDMGGELVSWAIL